MIGGRYTRERQIGRGGMGSVWLGRDEVLGRPVAMKRVGVMPGGSSPDLIRAEREARIAASLNHPHVVGVYDLIDDDGEQWMVMEYVAGTTLAELIRESGPLPYDRLSRIVTQAADALAAAHAAGIVHRDVKPSNILLHEDGTVKLSDFGIARASTDDSLTATGLVTGSPAYLAPEVASGQAATAASDVWSLGATAYHALTGRPPYDVGDNVLGGLYRIVHEDPPRLPAGSAGAALIEQTMLADPSARTTAAAVAGTGRPGPLPVAETVAASLPEVDPATVPIRPERSGPTQTSVVPGFDPRPADDGPVADDPGLDVAPHRGRRRRPLLPLVVAGLIIALIAVIVVLALQDDPQKLGSQPPSSPGDPSSSASPSSSPSSPSASPTPKPKAADMRQFVRSYLGQAPNDPQSTFAQLTLSFQQQSGGISDYTAFWGDVTIVRIGTISADPAALTVSYDYQYRKPGTDTRSDRVTLQLEFSDGQYLIDGEADNG